MSVYAEIQRTLAYVFAGICALLVVATIGVGGDAWPGLCWTRSITGSSCPDCGLVRGMLHTFAGDFDAATLAHAKAPFVAGWLAVQAPARFWLARRQIRGSTGWWLAAADLVVCVGAFGVMR